jgi:hypothetical protein
VKKVHNLKKKVTTVAEAPIVTKVKVAVAAIGKK